MFAQILSRAVDVCQAEIATIKRQVVQTIVDHLANNKSVRPDIDFATMQQELDRAERKLDYAYNFTKDEIEPDNIEDNPVVSLYLKVKTDKTNMVDDLSRLAAKLSPQR